MSQTNRDCKAKSIAIKMNVLSRCPNISNYYIAGNVHSRQYSNSYQFGTCTRQFSERFSKSNNDRALILTFLDHVFQYMFDKCVTFFKTEYMIFNCIAFRLAIPIVLFLTSPRNRRCSKHDSENELKTKSIFVQRMHCLFSLCFIKKCLFLKVSWGKTDRPA